jgi:predicted MPP superfamily phosphohydrolase
LLIFSKQADYSTTYSSSTDVDPVQQMLMVFMQYLAGSNKFHTVFLVKLCFENEERMTLNRRNFLKIGGLVVASGLVAAAGYLELNDEAQQPVVDHVQVPVKNLKPSLEGFTILQMSDIHLRPFTQPDLVKKAVEMSNRLHPDLVVLTGDYVWRNKEAAFELAPIIAGLNPRYGIYSVLGNHDLWLDVRVIKAAFAEARLPLLVNQGVEVNAGSGSLFLAGLDDGWSGKADLNLALEQAPAGAPVVLLLHEPDLVNQTSLDPRVSLQLSGHTHGGQIRLPGKPPFISPHLGREYDKGLYRVNDTWLYVNRGLGVISIPFRYNCPPEITLLTLVSA